MANQEGKRASKVAATTRSHGSKDTTTNKQPASPSSSTSKNIKVDKNCATSGPSSGLVISRNKHWRFISAFHGAWISMPIELLEIVANLNYSTPRPRPMDPAVVFDVLKVRKNVDEATTFAVGAANDVASSTLINVNSGIPYLNSLGHGAKLSKERKLRMRELACQKLARAYRLDEIASSVVSMQGTSALETVGNLVLQHRRDNLDAKYCHFFLERIPARQLVNCTSLEPLTDIISSGHAQIEGLRTRATVKNFQEDLEGAIEDLTEALKLARYRDPPRPSSLAPNAASRPEAETAETCRKFRNPNSVLSEDEQPTGLIGQLLFQRATAHLMQACRLVNSSLPPGNEEEGVEVSKARHDSRKHVKLVAKRALRDYMSFLSHFDYSPNLPLLFMIDFHTDIAIAARPFRSSSVGYSPLSQGHTVYNVAELFAATPPPGLPEYPLEKAAAAERFRNTRELVTFHPLLTEALHASLLCHSLLQTSVKELQRHANMVARLVRLCHGDPIFRETRSVSRTDWVEVLRRATDNWIHLGDTWEALCAPVMSFDQQKPPRPLQEAQPDRVSTAASLLHGGGSSSSSSSSSTAPTPGGKPPSTAALPSKPDHGPVSPIPPAGTHDPPPLEGPKDFPYCTGRATAISRWIREAPVVTGMAKKKKRSGKSGTKVNGVVAGMMGAMTPSRGPEEGR